MASSYFGNVGNARRGAADCHPCLQIVDKVPDECDEEEENDDDEEDDDVALHGCGGECEFGGAVKSSRGVCRLVVTCGEVWCF
jgi:hypothetical protein